MNRSLVARIVAAVSLLPAVVSCGHDSPTTPASRRAELTVHATTLASFSDGTIGVVVSYRRQGEQLVAVNVTPSSIPIVRGAIAQQSVDVDLAACLSDTQRADASQPGCPLVVELDLRNAAGTLIDRELATPPNRVMPGQVADIPAVALTEIKSVTITPPTSSGLHPGETVQLSATVRASDGSVVSDHPVSWSTSSAATATVNATTGAVTAVAPGAVTITATVGEKTDQTAFTVVTRVASVTLSPNPVTMDWNTQDTSKVTMTVTAFDASGAPITDLAGRSIVWASDDPTTATVAATDQPGQERVTGVDMGKTTISATVDGVRGTAQLVVQPNFGYLDNGSGDHTLAVGETWEEKMNFVTANNEREPAEPGQVSWVSMNPAVATVTQAGLVTGVAFGKAVIQGTYRGFTLSATITVAPPAPVATVEVLITLRTLIPRQTTQATAVPRDAQGIPLDNRSITWASQNSAVADVSSSGLVVGKAPGTTKILATSEGKTGSIDVTVIQAPVMNVVLRPTELALNVGATGTIAAEPLDDFGNDLTGRTVTWTTNDPAVATVNGTGTVTAVGVGTTTIVATSEGKSASATVTVSAVDMPNAPNGLVLGFHSTAPFTYAIDIKWNDTSNNETSFQVERAVGGTDNFVLNATVPGSNNAQGFSSDANNITENTLYTYRVRACNAVGCSAYSNAVPIPGPLREPTNLVAVRDGAGVRLTWQDNTTNEGMYAIFILDGSESPDMAPIDELFVTPNTTEFSAPGRAPGTTIYYIVAACSNVPGYGRFCSTGLISPKFTF
jgi:uncharacterized protein YjdB